jgi:hypothetical protein
LTGDSIERGWVLRTPGGCRLGIARRDVRVGGLQPLEQTEEHERRHDGDPDEYQRTHV